MDDSAEFTTERTIPPPPKVRIPTKGEDFLALQEEAENAAASIMKTIVDDAANEYLERYYLKQVPEFEVGRILNSFNCLLEVCNLIY